MPIVSENASILSLQVCDMGVWDGDVSLVHSPVQRTFEDPSNIRCRVRNCNPRLNGLIRPLVALGHFIGFLNGLIGKWLRK